MNSLQITLLCIIVIVFGYYASWIPKKHTDDSSCGPDVCSDPSLAGGVTETKSVYPWKTINAGLAMATKTALPQLPAIDADLPSVFKTASFGLG
jgi:hypothetical protein